MARRGAWKQEILIVLVLVLLVAGLAVLLTLQDTQGKNDRSFIREELGVLDSSIPISNASHKTETDSYQGKDVPKDEQKEITTDSGLKYTELRIGDGDKVKIGSKIAVNYKGTFQSGEEFDSNTKKPPYRLTVGAGEVIKGWDEGLLGMKNGGKRKLIIPYKLAYGDEGSPPRIPPKTDLVFVLEVVQVTNR